MATTKKLMARVGLGALIALAAPFAFAQTSTTTSSTTPTAPNTGAGGDMAQNLLLMGVSSAAVLGAAAYLASRKASAAR